MRRRLPPPDPVVLVVAGGVQVAVALGWFARLELTAEEVAQLGAGLVMIGSAIRMLCERRRRSAESLTDGSAPRPVERTISDRLANGLKAFSKKGRGK